MFCIQVKNYITPRLVVGIGARNPELDLGRTDSAVWSPREFRNGNDLKYHAVFTTHVDACSQYRAPRV